MAHVLRTRRPIRVNADETNDKIKPLVNKKVGQTALTSYPRSTLGEINTKKLANVQQKALDKPPLKNSIVKPTLLTTGTNATTQRHRQANQEQSLPRFALNLDFDLKKYESSFVPTEDIDENDKDDPQLMSIFTKTIYCHMRMLEEKMFIEKDYLKGLLVTPKMREILIDWLIQVHHKFKLLQETLYITVAILDRFLQNSGSDIRPEVFQLVGVTSMWIASKFEEIYAPEVNDFVVISDHSFEAKQMRSMERRILATLTFDIGRPHPLNFLRRCSKVAGANVKQHALAKYAMELSLQEYEFSHVLPSKLAAASLLLSLQVLFDPDARQWDDTMAYYSFYSESQLCSLVSRLASLLLQASAKLDDQKAKRATVVRKYTLQKLQSVSLLPELSPSCSTSSILMKLSLQQSSSSIQLDGDSGGHTVSEVANE